MLSIRLQRLGRKGYPVYRVVVQDSRQSPDSGKYVALLGNYNPHTKAVNLDKEKAELFLKNGAQPSDRIVGLFKAEKVAMPDWVKEPTKQDRKLRNPEKLRKNRPAGTEAPVAEEAAPEAAAEEAQPDTGDDTAASPEAPAENAEEEVAAEESPAEESPAEESPAEEEKPAEDSQEAPSEPPAEEPSENKE